MLLRASPCSARAIAAKFTPVCSRRPIATVVPVTGPLAGTVPVLAALYRSMSEAPPIGSMNPPTARRLLVPSTIQLMPRSAVLSAETSTMIACTTTCARRMSSLSITALSARMVRCGAVMTSALVSLSAQIVPVPPASETVAAVAALVGATARVTLALAAACRPLPPRRRRRAAAAVAEICSLSLAARSSARA